MANVGTSTKTARLNLRVAPQDNALFRRAAGLLNESLSDFLVKGARERAERLLADRTRFVLEDAEWDEFVAALDRPAEGKPAVVDLLRRNKP